ncbi:hypothetical protein LV716_07735 [Flagellimonas sp. HMM57]|uniref:hypothetical protein n=1 Tax=unclassified Flagellimonas TaxID=2644544 RepID=UPI0013CF4D94|nr:MULTISPECIES: hypothetical protein [unclassified Flagellimonas]UII77648.1 hypothetical protein LV716_07735 [Flagellimonas sp. HMM57]
MKQILVILGLLFSLWGSAQSYKLSNEKVLFEFKTTKGKELVIAMDSNEEYLVYRYGSENNIELEFPENLGTSWNKFKNSWYFRGGGVQNDAMDIDYLYFDKDGYRYIVFQESYAKSEVIQYGIKVINLKTSKKTIIKADPETVKGSLSIFRDMKKIEKGDELF